MFGELSNVPLRDIWNHEAQDFTPWLASNIDRLGKALGLDLELTEREAGVGDFSLDILAKDLGTNHTVIIENQLTQTDHDHLGKLLTYAAGFDASVIIWVSSLIRAEHRQALDWLNQRTDETTQVFGVVVELIRIDESRPAVTFKVVVSPNDWQKGARSRAASAPASSRSERYRAYFQSLIDSLREEHSFTNARSAQPQNWYTFSSGVTGIGYGANFTAQGKARSELYIDLGDATKNLFVLERLKEMREQIEPQFEDEIFWEELEERRACRIGLYIDGSIDMSDEELEAVREWQISNLLRLREAFGRLIGMQVQQARAH